MSVLNLTNDGLPNVLVVLHATVLRQGQRGISESGLLDLVAPNSVIDEKEKMAEQTLRRWIELGLFRKDGDQIFASTYPEGVRTASPVALRNFTRRAATKSALSAEANADLWGTAGAADLTRSLAWMMTLEASHTQSSALPSLASAHFPDTSRAIVQNNSRFAGLKLWVPFLGFGREPFSTIDPTVALRDALPEIISPGEVLPTNVFLERTATALPVLDHGRWQTEILSKTSEEPAYIRTGTLSTALSRALLCLRASRELTLRQRSDSGNAMVLSGVNGPRPDLTFHEVERPVEK